MEQRRMYLLEEMKERLKKERFDGDGIIVLHINHFLENSLYYNEHLKQIFGKLVFVGSPYQAQVADFTLPFTIDYPCYYGGREKENCSLFRNQDKICHKKGSFLEHCGYLIEEALITDLLPEIKKGRRLLILEDGGYFCQNKERWEKRWPILKNSIIGSVEQTTSGTKCSVQYYSKRGYDFPCVSVARSDLKMDVESVFIGSKIVEELNRFLYEADTFLDFHQVLLLGYGVVGRAAAKAMGGTHCELTVCDPSVKIQAAARLDGRRVIKDPVEYKFSRDTVVLGTAGISSFSTHMLLRFLNAKGNRLYLASGSSKEVEFMEIKRLLLSREKLDGWEIRQDMNKNGFFSSYTLRRAQQEKRICLLADGMPVNFYRTNATSLTFCAMDLVFTEMLICGLWLCDEKNIEKRMYLAGKPGDHIEGMDESALFDRWCEIYGLLKNWPEPHPEKEYLRSSGMK